MKTQRLSDGLTTQEVKEVVREVVNKMNLHNRLMGEGKYRDTCPLEIPFILERGNIYDDWLLDGFSNGSYSFTEEEDDLYTKRLQELFRMFTRQELETEILDYSYPKDKVYVSGILHDYLEGEIQLVTSITHPSIDTDLDTLFPKN